MERSVSRAWLRGGARARARAGGSATCQGFQGYGITSTLLITTSVVTITIATTTTVGPLARPGAEVVFGQVTEGLDVRRSERAPGRRHMQLVGR